MAKVIDVSDYVGGTPKKNKPLYAIFHGRDRRGKDIGYFVTDIINGITYYPKDGDLYMEAFVEGFKNARQDRKAILGMIKKW